jgi:hypothetical protein
VSASSSLSDFADSFSAKAGSILLWSSACSAGGVAALIAIAAPKPIKQKRANHIVLDILDPNAPAVWIRM